MIAELGHFALILALVMATVQTAVPLIGAHRSNTVLMEIGKPSAIAQFFAILLFQDLLCSGACFVASDDRLNLMQ